MTARVDADVTARLVIHGPMGVRVEPLGDAACSLGRDPSCALQLEGAGVSRFHCTLERWPGEGHCVRDGDSTNGVYVNDRRVRLALLEPFDRLRLGELVLIYLDPLADAEKVRAALAPEETARFDVSGRRDGKLDELVWLTLMIQDTRGGRALRPTLEQILQDLEAMSGGRAMILLEEGGALELAFGGADDPALVAACLEAAGRAMSSAERCEVAAPEGRILCLPMRERPRVPRAVERRGAPDVRPRGVLTLARLGARAFARREELLLLEAFARQLAVLICRANMERLAMIDPLTGLCTRAWMEDALRGELALTRGAVLAIDVDDFKQVNDAHGHGVGDDLLRALGENVRAAIRETDWAARWGGDELLVVLPGADGAAASRVAEAIVRAVATTSVSGLPRGGSVSIGVATGLDRSDRLADLVAEADEAMYDAKRRGKGQVALHPRVAAALTASSSSATAWLECPLLPPIPLRTGVSSVGRDATCDVVLSHPLVSRLHGRLHVADGSVAFEDASSNGTWINGVLVDGRASLAMGDRVLIGPFAFLLRRGVQPAAPPLAAARGAFEQTRRFRTFLAPR